LLPGVIKNSLKYGNTCCDILFLAFQGLSAVTMEEKSLKNK
jgi:hypothetical protein